MTDAQARADSAAYGPSEALRRERRRAMTGQRERLVTTRPMAPRGQQADDDLVSEQVALAMRRRTLELLAPG
jgi:hypothetical protein